MVEFPPLQGGYDPACPFPAWAAIRAASTPSHPCRNWTLTPPTRQLSVPDAMDSTATVATARNSPRTASGSKGSCTNTSRSRLRRCLRCIARAVPPIRTPDRGETAATFSQQARVSRSSTSDQSSMHLPAAPPVLRSCRNGRAVLGRVLDQASSLGARRTQIQAGPQGASGQMDRRPQGRNGRRAVEETIGDVVGVGVRSSIVEGSNPKWRYKPAAWLSLAWTSARHTPVWAATTVATVSVSRVPTKVKSSANPAARTMRSTVSAVGDLRPDS